MKYSRYIHQIVGFSVSSGCITYILLHIYIRTTAESALPRAEISQSNQIDSFAFFRDTDGCDIRLVYISFHEIIKVVQNDQGILMPPTDNTYDWFEHINVALDLMEDMLAGQGLWNQSLDAFNIRSPQSAVLMPIQQTNLQYNQVLLESIGQGAPASCPSGLRLYIQDKDMYLTLMGLTTYNWK